MMTRPPYIMASELDIRDPKFPAQCLAWTGQMRSEMNDLVMMTERTIATSKAVIKKTDRLLAWR